MVRLDNILFGQLDKAGKSVKTIAGSRSVKDLVDNTVTEGLTFVGSNVNDIMKWTVGSFARALGSMAKLTLNGASLIPLPLPGGPRRMADFRGDMHAARSTFDAMVKGEPGRARHIFARIGDIRDHAQAFTNPQAPTAA